jgi:hypothetical protein
VTFITRLVLAVLLAGSCAWTGHAADAATSDSEAGWTPLINGKDFDGWYTFLPSTGKNSDPKKVFKMEDGMVHILDIPETDERQEFGYLASEREFSNCRIRVEFKWGKKRFVPNNENKRDSGLLYFFNVPTKSGLARWSSRFRKPTSAISGCSTARKSPPRSRPKVFPCMCSPGR